MLNLFAFFLLVQFSTWVACFGFTLGFGGMFLKTWRVHKIFLNRTKKIVSTRIVKVWCSYSKVRLVGTLALKNNKETRMVKDGEDRHGLQTTNLKLNFSIQDTTIVT